MKAIIRNFHAYFVLYQKQHDMYKVNVFSKFLYIPLHSFALAVIWYVIASNNPNIDYKEMLIYYVMCSVMNATFPFARKIRENQDTIYSGGMTPFYTRPGGFFLARFAYFGAWLLQYAVVALPTVAIMALLCNGLVSFLPVLINVLLFMFLGILVAYLQWSILLIFTFWMRNIFGVIKIYYTLIALLSGSLVPYSILPRQFQELFDVLPFKFYAYFPALIVTQGYQLHEVLKELALVIMYIILSFVLLNILLQRGKKRYDGGLH